MHGLQSINQIGLERVKPARIIQVLSACQFLTTVVSCLIVWVWRFKSILNSSVSDKKCVY